MVNKKLFVQRAIFYFLLLFFVISLVFLLFNNIKSISQSCPITKQKGNPAYFSQTYEDYVLSIVFSGITAGTYIDAGAYHPQEDSVTLYFYNKGWHGINIEPSPIEYRYFITARPHDINLNVGVGNKVETLTFYRIPQTGLSTFDKKTAEQAKRDGFPYVIEYLPVTTLNAILEKYPLKEIHFIKIDVEGFEKQVLQGIDLRKYRPHVFIIESTEPRSTKPSYQQWEEILLKNHYQFALSDGLNRYYVADEQADKLLSQFSKAKGCLMSERID